MGESPRAWACAALLLVLTAFSRTPCAAECSTGTKVSDACLGLAYEGCCEGGGAAAWCDSPEGPTCRHDCAADGQVCGWAGGYYWCGGDGADPSGIFALACPACDPPCEANSFCAYGACLACGCGDQACGFDACGNPCGDCGPDATCSSGQCVPIPTCVASGTLGCDGQAEGDAAEGAPLVDGWACGVYAPGPEVAYAFTPAVADHVAIEIKGDPSVRVILAKGTCRTEACVSYGIDALAWQAVVAGETYYVVVDTAQVGSGHYVVALRCQSTCTPACVGKACGDDGCGGSCGACDGACVNGVCYASDGCGSEHLTGSVGCPGCACEACVCAHDEYCCLGEWDGVCQVECAAVCGSCGALDACDDGTCAGAENCLICPDDCPCGPGEVCTAQGTCCAPSCDGKVCGDDGCGVACGSCEAPWQCDGAGQCSVCVPQCVGRQCGDDGCSGSCGACDAGLACLPDGSCECTPRCENRQCGDDGCGGSCGGCPAGRWCQADGTCAGCEPQCAGKQCGDDGCGGSCGACEIDQVCSAGECVWVDPPRLEEPDREVVTPEEKAEPREALDAEPLAEVAGADLRGDPDPTGRVGGGCRLGDGDPSPTCALLLVACGLLSIRRRVVALGPRRG